MKVCLVGSSGGHLTHLYMLKPFWKDKDHFWVTFDKEDARSLLEGEVLENVRVTDKKAAQNDPVVQEAVSKVAEALVVFWCMSPALSLWCVSWWKHQIMILVRSMLTKWLM